MARPSSFSQAEDEIILETSGKPASETNRLLEAAGFPHRTSDAIKNRRLALKRRRNDFAHSVSDWLPAAGEDDTGSQLALAIARRNALTHRLAKVEGERAALEAEMASLVGQIHELLRQFDSEIARLSRDTAVAVESEQVSQAQ